ncbi:hypothetical protein [Deinococcus apachensis]|uniref:hypothetical protein n=1 Tax=Deinococcus apachensis TaxID=309886 RepID=UPI000476C9FC|nr:hypothetical protein [Deinococcus apachensis]
MNRPRALALLTLLALATPAQALKLIVLDRELQTPLASGETSGNRMVVQFVPDYTGPVVVLFSRDDEEKARGLYPTLKSRYDGDLKAGQLTLDIPNGTQTLARFLSGFGLTLQSQAAGQSLSLPGLRVVPDKSKSSDPKNQGDR